MRHMREAIAKCRMDILEEGTRLGVFKSRVGSGLTEVTRGNMEQKEREGGEREGGCVRP